MIDNLTEAISHAREVAEKQRGYTKALGPNPVTGAAKNYINLCLECAAEHDQLADWLTELQERREADRWNVIRTEEDLPKESDWYLVTRIFNSRKYVATVFFNENTKSFYEDSCTPLNNITHWRPLPKPYESEEE